MIIKHKVGANEALYKFYPYGNEAGEFVVNIGQTQATRMSWLQGGEIPTYKDDELNTLIEEGRKNVAGLSRAVLGNISGNPADQPQGPLQLGTATTSVYFQGAQRSLWEVLSKIAEKVDVKF